MARYKNGHANTVPLAERNVATAQSVKCTKIGYPTKRLAKDGAKRNKRKFGGRAAKHAYLCHCGRWHLTSQTETQRLEMLARKRGTLRAAQRAS